MEGSSHSVLWHVCRLFTIDVYVQAPAPLFDCHLYLLQCSTDYLLSSGTWLCSMSHKWNLVAVVLLSILKLFAVVSFYHHQPQHRVNVLCFPLLLGIALSRYVFMSTEDTAKLMIHPKTILLFIHYLQETVRCYYFLLLNLLWHYLCPCSYLIDLWGSFILRGGRETWWDWGKLKILIHYI